MNKQRQAYPKPKVPIAPLPSLPSFFSRMKTNAPFILDTESRIEYVTSGRVAIARALQMAGVTAGTRVLVPAYHCPSMADPITWMGALPIYYKCDADLTPNGSDLERKTDEHTRALIVVHYFGFAQPQIEKLAEFCGAHKITLIEDCAHAIFGHHNQRTLGSFGQHAIASPAKFFPIYDGGIHIMNSDSTESPEALSRAQTSFELKALINPIEKSVIYQHFFPFNTLFKILFMIMDALRKLRKSKNVNGEGGDLVASSPDSVDGGFAFDPSWLNIRMSFSSRLSLKLASKRRIVERRRKNYLKLVAAFAEIDGCRSVFASLPDMIVPYVFPLVVDNAPTVFDQLKSEGVPIYRWDSLYTDICATSNRYSIELFQLPCHQELTRAELDWIIARVLHAVQNNK